MSLTIHQTGIDASINAQANGFSGATLSDVDLYDGSTKIKRLTLEGVAVIEPGRIYVVAKDQTPGLSYNVTKMEFITNTGALFATAQYNDGSIIQSKGPDSILLLSEQLNISAAPGSIAPSGNVSIYMPPATESLLGGAEIATQSEVNTGSDHTRIVTPKTLKSWLASFTRNATETVKGFLEIATQTEVNTGTDHTRAVTPKTLWGLLNAKFARTDVRPTFSQGIDTNGKPVRFGGGSSQFEGIKYDDATDQPGTFHFVADGNVDESSDGNAFLKMAGITLSSGNKVTGVSDSVSSSSTTILASSKAAKTAYDAGTRSASETQKGQVERATQAEVDAGTDDSRYVSPKKLLTWINSKFKSAAFLDAGQSDGQVAKIGDTAVAGNTAVVVASGNNANGEYRIFSDGFIEQWGLKDIRNNKIVTYPISFNTGGQVLISKDFAGVACDIQIRFNTATKFEVSTSVPPSSPGIIFWRAYGK
ncbi:hypothetical protein [Endozoicomonas sp. ALC066]|uniref:hypothetical protein n=1 Tax=Endozoicomonas sp. ALC066 TaxID=3403078 RepID=UPI003BB698FD